MRVRYLHSDIDTLERVQILRDLRLGDVRRARRHQPAARRARPAGGVARRDPRRGQGRLPAIGRRADPDDRPGGAQRARPGDPVRRRDDRFDAAGDRRDRAAPRACRRRTTRSTASRRRRSSRTSTTCCRACTSATTSRCRRPPTSATRFARQAELDAFIVRLEKRDARGGGATSSSSGRRAFATGSSGCATPISCGRRRAAADGGACVELARSAPSSRCRSTCACSAQIGRGPGHAADLPPRHRRAVRRDRHRVADRRAARRARSPAWCSRCSRA